MGQPDPIAGIRQTRLLYFVYLDGFIDDWNSIFRDSDEMRLWDLETAIMESPDGAPVVPSGSGLRKMRFGLDGTGKRGGVRVLYVHFPEHHLVLMMLAYGKSEKADLSQSELQVIQRLIAQVKKWLDSRT